MKLLATFRKLLKRNDGATAIEYGLVAAGIALAIIPAVNLIGNNLKTTLTTLAESAASGDVEACDPGDCEGPPPPLPPAD